MTISKVIAFPCPSVTVVRMSHMVTAMPNVFFLLHMFLLIILIQFAVIKGVKLAHPCDTLGVLTPPRTKMPGRWSWPGLVKLTRVPPTAR